MIGRRYRSVCSLGLAIVASALFAACRSAGPDPADYVRARFLMESFEKDGYSAVVALPISQVRIPVKGDAVLSEYDYASIGVAEVELGKCLVFTLKPAAARAFYQLTAANQGRRLVLLVDGEPLGARRVDSPISDGRIHIFVEATDEALEELASRLQETNIDIQKQLKG